MKAGSQAQRSGVFIRPNARHGAYRGAPCGGSLRDWCFYSPEGGLACGRRPLAWSRVVCAAGKLALGRGTFGTALVRADMMIVFLRRRRETLFFFFLFFLIKMSQDAEAPKKKSENPFLVHPLGPALAGRARKEEKGAKGMPGIRRHRHHQSEGDVAAFGGRDVHGGEEDRAPSKPTWSFSATLRAGWAGRTPHAHRRGRRWSVSWAGWHGWEPDRLPYPR